MRKIPKIFLFAVLCITAAGLASCGKAEMETTEDGRQILYIARPADEGDTYQAEKRKSELNRLIYEFNRKSESYVVKDKYYESGEKLLLEIMSGKQPDLLCKSDACSWVDSAPLYGKSLLCDLNRFIDEKGIRDRYVPSVLEAMEIDGRLYEMPYSFSITTAMARTAVWNGDSDTSPDHVIEKTKQLGLAAPIDFHTYDESFTPYVCSEFIDYSGGSCCFEDGRFGKYLEFRKQCSDAAKRLSPDGLIFEEFLRGNVLMMCTGIGSFYQHQYLIVDYVGENITFTGLPSDIENYHTIDPVLSFWVFSGSVGEAGAYEFIDHATSFGSYIETYDGGSRTEFKNSGFPVNGEALRFMAEDHYKNSGSDGFSKEDCAESIRETYRQIQSVNGVGNRFDGAVNDILSEETAAYFNGTKTLEETCGNIQNRVSLYLAEQYR